MKLVLICTIPSIAAMMFGCTTTHSQDAPLTNIRQYICTSREQANPNPGDVLKIRSRYSYVTNHEEFLFTPSCPHDTISISKMLTQNKSVHDFIAARDSKCMRRGAVVLCAINANVEATIQVTANDDSSLAADVMDINVLKWLD